MTEEEKIQLKTEKTLKLFGYMNLALSPLYLPLGLIDSRICLASMIVFNASMIAYLHGLGQRRRPVAQVKTFFGSLFAEPRQADRIEANNHFRNIINGGAVIHDEIAESSRRAKPSRS
jgi:hypothetical protein